MISQASLAHVWQGLATVFHRMHFFLRAHGERVLCMCIRVVSGQLKPVVLISRVKLIESLLSEKPVPKASDFLITSCMYISRSCFDVNH